LKNNSIDNISDLIITKDNNIDFNNTINQSYCSFEEIKKYKELIHQNIGYEFICKASEKTLIDELVDIMIDAFCESKVKINIGGKCFDTEYIKQRFFEINSYHIEYVVVCFKKNKTKISNLKNYLLTSLYNSTLTLDSYLASEINCDL